MIKSITIGQYVTAYPNEEKSWVRAENTKDDEYRDVFDNEGRLIYCNGETCIIKDIDLENSTITLQNDNIDTHDFSDIFTISLEQFESDFI